MQKIKNLVNSERLLFKLLLLFALIATFGCSEKISESISAESLPPEIDKTVVLVTNFHYHDPMIYNPVYLKKQKQDSIKKLNIFSYTAAVDSGNPDVNNQPAKFEHPLIVQTNAHIEDYNKKLVSTWKKYKYKYVIVSQDSLESSPKFNDLSKYRYILIRKPEILCYINPDQTSILTYKYSYYFHDRLLKKDIPEIDLYTSDLWRTEKAVIYRMNHLYDK
jgi:hypothetical protein